MKIKTTLAMLAIGASALAVRAQDGNSPDGNPPNGPREHHRPPPSPLAMTLDANHDGVIDADEIANASAALKTLDKNGDGQLTRDEFCPPPRRMERFGNDQNPPDDAPGAPLRE